MLLMGKFFSHTNCIFFEVSGSTAGHNITFKFRDQRLQSYVVVLAAEEAGNVANITPKFSHSSVGVINRLKMAIRCSVLDHDFFLDFTDHLHIRDITSNERSAFKESGCTTPCVSKICWCMHQKTKVPTSHEDNSSFRGRKWVYMDPIYCVRSAFSPSNRQCVLVS